MPTTVFKEIFATVFKKMKHYSDTQTPFLTHKSLYKMHDVQFDFIMSYITYIAGIDCLFVTVKEDIVLRYFTVKEQ